MSSNTNMKRIRQGNIINFRYSVYRLVGKQKEPEDLTSLVGLSFTKSYLLQGSLNLTA